MTQQLKESTPLTQPASWIETHDRMGLKPAEPVLCPICSIRNLAKGKSTFPSMQLRRSRIHTVPDVREERLKDGTIVRPYAMDMAFKCPVCDFYCVFGVPMDMEYAQKIQQLRGGTPEYVLPKDDWDEDERIKSKLEKVGYW